MYKDQAEFFVEITHFFEGEYYIQINVDLRIIWFQKERLS